MGSLLLLHAASCASLFEPVHFIDYTDGFRYAVMDDTARETTHQQCLNDPSCAVCQKSPIELADAWALAPFSMEIVTSVVKQHSEAFEDTDQPGWGTYYLVLSNNVAYSTADVHLWQSDWLIHNGSSYSTRDCWSKVLIRTPAITETAHCHLGSAFGGVGYGCVTCSQAHAEALPAAGCANMRANCKYELPLPIKCPIDWSLWIYGKKMPFNIPQAVALIMSAVILLSVSISLCCCRKRKRHHPWEKKEEGMALDEGTAALPKAVESTATL